MKIQKQIEVRLMKKVQTSSLRVVQFDTGVQLVFNILDFDLETGTTATFYARKKSGKFVYQETGITLNENTVTVDLDNQALTEHGEVHYQLRFRNGSDTISTFYGIMFVDPSIADADAEESKTVIAAFNTMTMEKIAEIEAATEEFIAQAQAMVADKGVEVIATIPADYTETSRKADRATRTKADAIICAAEGDPIAVADASDNPLRGLRVFGKTKQITTTGAQLADFINGTNAAGIMGTFENDVMTVVGDGSALYQNYGINITDIFKNNPGKILYFDYERMQSAKELDGTLAQLNFLMTDGTRKYVGMCTNKGTKVPYTIPDDTSGFSSVNFCIYTTNNATAQSNTITITKPMLQFGSVKLPYEPYTGTKASPSPEYPQDLKSVGSAGSIAIKVVGNNLFDVHSATIREGNGLKATVNQDGSVTVNGTPTGAYAQAFSGTIKLPKGKYFVSGGENAAGCAYFQLYANKIGGGQKYAINGLFEVDGTEDGDVHYSIQSGNVLDPVENYTLYPMFNIGTVQMDFEPFKSGGAMTLQFPSGLPGVPVSSGGNYTDANGQQWVCDEVDLEQGLYVQRIKRFLASEMEWIAERTEASYYEYKTYSSTVAIENGNLYSTHFAKAENNRMVAGSNRNVYARFPAYTGIDTAEKAREFFATEEVVFLARLVNPVEIPMTAEEIEAFKAVHSNYPNTTVLNDAGALIEIKYNADTKLFVANLLDGCSAGSAATIGEVTLLAANWKGAGSPYSQVVQIYGVTENSQVDLTPSIEQLAIFHNKDLAFVTENEGGVVTVYALGDKPTNDYTIQVTITEVYT